LGQARSADQRDRAGLLKTPLNQALVDNPEFSSRLEKRTPAGRWGNVEELVGEAVFLSGKASSFINGHALHVDGGITTSWPPDNCPRKLAGLISIGMNIALKQRGNIVRAKGTRHAFGH
jgi:Enoyl-(Acyl carrier protein) reductase